MPKTPENWTRVEIQAVPGTEFGVVSDSDGVLILTVRSKDGVWQDEPPPLKTRTTIASGCTRFVIEQD